MTQTDITGVAQPMTDLVRFSPKSVVSRTLVQKNAGTVTLFALDSGESISEHTAPYDAFVYLAEGSMTITIGGVPVILGRGDCLIMPAGRPHALKAGEKSVFLLVMIREQ